MHSFILQLPRDAFEVDDRYGFFVYFDLLKRNNDEAPQYEKRAIEELLLDALTVYLPRRWRRVLNRKKQRF